MKHDMTRDMKNPMEERDSTIAVLRHTISGLERQLQESVGDIDSKLIPLQEVGLLLLNKSEHNHWDVYRIKPIWIELI